MRKCNTSRGSSEQLRCLARSGMVTRMEGCRPGSSTSRSSRVPGCRVPAWLFNLFRGAAESLEEPQGLRALTIPAKPCAAKHRRSKRSGADDVAGPPVGESSHGLASCFLLEEVRVPWRHPAPGTQEEVRARVPGR